MGQKAPAIAKRRGRGAVGKQEIASTPTGSDMARETYDTVQSVGTAGERLSQTMPSSTAAAAHLGQVLGGNRIVSARDPRRLDLAVKVQELPDSSDPPSNSYLGSCSSIPPPPFTEIELH